MTSFLSSEFVVGLQRALNKLEECCNKWKLEVNVQKTKVLICSKENSKSKKEVRYYKNERFEVVHCKKFYVILKQFIIQKRSTHFYL